MLSELLLCLKHLPEWEAPTLATSQLDTRQKDGGESSVLWEGGMILSLIDRNRAPSPSHPLATKTIVWCGDLLPGQKFPEHPLPKHHQ
jgi:hypothetical protein